MWSYLAGFGLGFLYVAASVVPALLILGLALGWPAALPLLALLVVLILVLPILLERDQHERRKLLRATALGLAWAAGVLLAVYGAIGMLRWMDMHLPETDGWVGMVLGVFALLLSLRSWLLKKQSAKLKVVSPMQGK